VGDIGGLQVVVAVVAVAAVVAVVGERRCGCQPMKDLAVEV
jgi:hypothetical protein